MLCGDPSGGDGSKRRRPQGLKPAPVGAIHGTTEVVPFPIFPSPVKAKSFTGPRWRRQGTQLAAPETWRSPFLHVLWDDWIWFIYRSVGILWILLRRFFYWRRSGVGASDWAGWIRRIVRFIHAVCAPPPRRSRDSRQDASATVEIQKWIAIPVEKRTPFCVLP